MSTKHTPGPCAAISRHNDVVNIETTSGTILGMSMKTDRLTPEEVQANATLWAAAPDLLEACRIGRDIVLEARDSEHGLRQTASGKAMAIMEAAITQATGKEAPVALDEQECLYGNGADCNSLPQGVVRSVCLPCKARAVAQAAAE